METGFSTCTGTTMPGCNQKKKNMKATNLQEKLAFTKNVLVELNDVHMKEINGGTSTYAPISIFTKMIADVIL